MTFRIGKAIAILLVVLAFALLVWVSVFGLNTRGGVDSSTGTIATSV